MTTDCPFPDFRHTLVKVGGQLTDTDQKSLAFLAEGKAPGLSNDCWRWPMNLFTVLEQHRQISADDQEYLKDLLLWIGRRDLAEMFENSQISDATPDICCMRAMLYKIFEHLSKEETGRLRHLWMVPSKYEINDGVDLSLYLLRSGRLGSNTSRPIDLRQDLQEIGRFDMAEIVTAYYKLSNNGTPDRDILEAIDRSQLCHRKQDLVVVTRKKIPLQPLRMSMAPDLLNDPAPHYASNTDKVDGGRPPRKLSEKDVIWTEIVEDANENPILTERIDELKEEIKYLRHEREKMDERLQALNLKLAENFEEFEKKLIGQMHDVFKSYVGGPNRGESYIRDLIDTMIMPKLLPEMKDLREGISDSWDNRRFDQFSKPGHNTDTSKVETQPAAPPRERTGARIILPPLPEESRDKETRVKPKHYSTRENLPSARPKTSHDAKNFDGGKPANKQSSLAFEGESSPRPKRKAQGPPSREELQFSLSPRVPTLPFKGIENTPSSQQAPKSQSNDEQKLTSSTRSNGGQKRPLSPKAPIAQSNGGQKLTSSTKASIAQSNGVQKLTSSPKPPIASNRGQKLPLPSKPPKTQGRPIKAWGSVNSLASNDSVSSKTSTASIMATPGRIFLDRSQTLCGVPRIDELRESRIETEKPGITTARIVQESWHVGKYVLKPERCYILTHLSFLHVLLRCERKFSGSIYVREFGCEMRAFVQPTNVGTCLSFGIEPYGPAASKFRKTATNGCFSIALKVVLRGGALEDIMLRDVIVGKPQRPYSVTQKVNLSKMKDEGYFLGGDVVIQFYLNILQHDSLKKLLN